jgi:hypothetical protein
MRFVVATIPRTGSTMFCEALQRHPSIRCAMEIFNPHLAGTAPHLQDHSHATWRATAFQELYGMSATDAITNHKLDENRVDLSRLLDRVWNDWDGFKLILSHVQPNSPVLDRLENDPTVKMILLRRDFLEACYSYKIASVSRVWQTTAKGEHDEPFEFPIDEVMWFFDEYGKREDDVAVRFPNALTVTHHALVHEWADTWDAALLHIGAPAYRLQPRIQKRTLRPFEQIITNHAAIQKALWTSEHAHRLQMGPVLL